MESILIIVAFVLVMVLYLLGVVYALPNTDA